MRKHHDVFFIQGSGLRVQRGQCGAYKQGSVVNVYGAMPKGFLTAGFPRIVSLPQWGWLTIRGCRYPRHTAFPSRGRCPEGADRALAG